MDPLPVRVDFGGRGGWAIALPGEPKSVTCDSLEDARRIAHVWAEGRGRCEVVVCDAYHRVLSRELVARAPGRADAAMN